MEKALFRDWLLKCVLLVAALAGFGIKAEAQNVVETGDSVGRMRVDVNKTSPQNEDDIKKRPIDLVTPKNMKEDAELDESGGYRLGTKIGDSYLNTPVLLTRDEYMRWSLKQSMQKILRKQKQRTFQE